MFFTKVSICSEKSKYSDFFEHMVGFSTRKPISAAYIFAEIENEWHRFF
ncbi:hypothetical protein BRDCF_p1831 [Bacteroidales bacterium CF]|nr:hypothetical protein BRDCF_p1831 [Bacteroidales bacterium CF]